MIPALTTAQMREVDRIMVEDLGITLPQMMENAGRALAWLAVERYSPNRVTVLAGSGGNGGGGMVAARHLANRDIAVTVVTVRPPAALGGVPRLQAAILEQMDVALETDPSQGDLVIDAVIGYSLQGNPSGRAADLIGWANSQPAPVLALDTPSGLDTTTGAIGDPCVRADATLTLALPKLGLYESPEVAGDLYLADISVPPGTYRRFGIEVGDLFAGRWVVEVAHG